MQRLISHVHTGKLCREGGGFIVRRALGDAIPMCDPFLMLDHFGPREFGPGEAVGAPDHPHRGFETVTYMITGEICHRDSQGNSGNLGPGWVQWMTAGSGVVHSEMPSDKMIKNGGTMEGFQLWVNLPAKDKMIPPRYQDTSPEKIPVVSTPDNKVSVKVIAGDSLGTSAYIDTRTPIMCLDIRLAPGSEFTQPVPRTYQGFVYVWRGKVSMGPKNTPVEYGQTALLDEGSELKIVSQSNEESRLLLIAGEPLNEPVVKSGPFVMDTQEEIQQAMKDYKEGRLGHIPGAEARRKQAQEARETQKRTGTWDKL